MSSNSNMIELIASCVSHEISKPIGSPLNALHDLQDDISFFSSSYRKEANAIILKIIEALNNLDSHISHSYNFAVTDFRARKINTDTFLNHVLDNHQHFVIEASRLSLELTQLTNLNSKTINTSRNPSKLEDGFIRQVRQIRRMILALTRVLPAIRHLAELGKENNNRERVSLEPIFKDALRFSTSSAEVKGRTFSNIEFECITPSIIATRGLFIRYLTNILTNSLKYGDQHSKIRVKNVLASKSYIHSRLETKNAYGSSSKFYRESKKWDQFYLLEIHDDGKGIPIDKRPLVTDLFFRMKNDASYEEKIDDDDTNDPYGLANKGIGLAVCRLISLSHRGGIFFGDSEFGRGICCYSVWPKAYSV